MSLSAGARFGPYEILSAIGAGGMGEVYRARDVRLGRDVALKVLPDAFALDVDRLGRFRREAQVLASLNHPNIAAIYNIEEDGDIRALVLELVSGATLADRIAQGRIPIDEALPIARQIAEALEAAHEQGIIHRDLKPANIKAPSDGPVKVLDFGLAKALEPTASGSSGGLSMSPTLSVHATYAGTILGTAAYMSPEQARGRVVDRRTDVWAFGCVLFEMLTGQQPFPVGETVSDAIAAILKSEPDWSALPPDTPAHIERLLRRCLQKDPQKRLPHIGVARIEIDEGSGAVATPSANAAAANGGIRPAPAGRQFAILAGTAVFAIAATSAGWWFARPVRSTPAVVRFQIPADKELSVNLSRNQVGISPDGTQVVWAANGQLYARSISDTNVRVIPGSDTAQPVNSPVFSPDGQSIAFYAQDQTFKKIPLAGGSAVTICSGNNPLGVSWGPEGIVFAEPQLGVLRVSPNGGMPDVLRGQGDAGLLYGPQILPGGEAVLYTESGTTGGNQWDQGRIIVQSLKTGQSKTLVQGGSDGRYVPTGHLIYALGGTLYAVVFDLKRLEVVGGAVPILEGVRRSGGGVTGASHYSFSTNGTLVYIPGPLSSAANLLDIGLTDRQGGIEPLKLPPASYEYPRVSPDGKYLAVGTDDGRDASVWVYNLDGGSAIRRLTLEGKNHFPVWSSDSQRVAFQSDREKDLAIWVQRADGLGPAERLTRPGPGTAHVPESWSPNGETLLFSSAKETVNTLWALTLANRTVKQFPGVEGRGAPPTAMFSPDGRWVAYSSNPRGTPTIFVEPYPPTGARYEVSTRAGDVPHHPLWSPDGKELFYVPRGGAFETVSITTKPAIAFGAPISVPRGFPTAGQQTPRTFDITPSGKIVGVVTAGQTRTDTIASQLIVVLNWFEDLKSRVPGR